MSDTTPSTTETIVNDVATAATTAIEVAFPSVTALLSAFNAGLPVAEALYNDAVSEFNNVINGVTVTPAQIAADDAALDTEDAALQAIQPAAPSV
jgi:hypothetical protein